MAYTYTGTGIVISIADAGGEEVFLGAVNEVFDCDFTDMQEFANGSPFGEYESPDNIDEARVNGNPVETLDGVCIVSDAKRVFSERYQDIDSLMDMLGFYDWQDDPDIAGAYVVECQQ